MNRERSRQAPRRGLLWGLRTRVSIVCVLAIALCIVLALLWPAARQSTQALCNRVFDASEAVNSYAYEHFSVPDHTGVALAGALASVIAASLSILAVVIPGAAPALVLMVGTVLAQAYFGLSLPAWANVLLYALLALIAVCKQAGRRAAIPFAACAAAVALATAALIPGTSAPVETASEQVRDWLGAAFTQQTMESSEERSLVMETRHENRRDTLAGDQDSDVDRDYRLVTVEEQQISLPHWIDYLRIVMLCLMVPVLLAMPFVPFVWLNRRAQKTAKRLACLDDPDNAAAIRGMFSLVIGYLDAARVGDANALYRHRLQGVEEERLPAGFAEQYAACAALWQEAAYSGHDMTEDQRARLLNLLEETEHHYFDQADWRTRLKLRYVHCLHE